MWFPPRYQSPWGQRGARLGPVGPRWAPCCPHEPFYQGLYMWEQHFNLETSIFYCSHSNKSLKLWFRYVALIVCVAAFYTTDFIRQLCTWNDNSKNEPLPGFRTIVVFIAVFRKHNFALVFYSLITRDIAVSRKITHINVPTVTWHLKFWSRL